MPLDPDDTLSTCGGDELSVESRITETKSDVHLRTPWAIRMNGYGIRQGVHAWLQARGAATAAAYVPLSFPFIAVAVCGFCRAAGLRSPRATGSIGATCFAGLRSILRDPTLRGALLMVFTTSILCGPLLTFSPILVKDAFHREIGDFSIAVTAFGIGGLLGAIGLLGVPASYDRRHLSSRFAAIYGVIVVLIGLDPWFWGLPVLLIFGGLSMTASHTSANALLHWAAATEKPRATIHGLSAPKMRFSRTIL